MVSAKSRATTSVVPPGGKGHDDPEIALRPGLRAHHGWRGERSGGQRGQHRTTRPRGHARNSGD
jgi:hypothetical protein